MICTCLTLAGKDGATSIAFPTVGCGKLGYHPEVVVDCFLRARRDTNTTLQVQIIASSKSVLATFKGVICGTKKDAQREDKKVASGDQAAEPTGADEQRPSSSNIVVFEIRALDQAAVSSVKQELKKKMNDVIVMTQVNVEIELSPGCKADIRQLGKPGLMIVIDKAGQQIELKGSKAAVKKCKRQVNDVLEKHKQIVESAEYIKVTKGVAEYLAHVGSNIAVPYPSYWGQAKGQGKLKELQPDSEIYKEVSALVMKTWDAAKARGLGHDARNLSHSNISVKKISVVENAAQFEAYNGYRKGACLIASVNPFPPVAGLKGESEVSSRTLGLKLLDKNLVAEVNECYLFHGTKKDLVDVMTDDGIDSRLAGESVLYGKGAYFAESSTKADQYTDDRDSRVGLHKSLYMFVVRVLLGNAYIAQQPMKGVVRPPCVVANCPLRDRCSDRTHMKHHSVIGTHKENNQRLIFREFVVYERNQSYPEFLVEYQRQ